MFEKRSECFRGIAAPPDSPLFLAASPNTYDAAILAGLALVGNLL